jgi:hypothetical protein
VPEIAQKPLPENSFRARCEARAQLFAAGEIGLHEAVDVLQHDAEATGLVADIGQDAVQEVMSAAFAASTELGTIVPDSVDCVPDIPPLAENPDYSSAGFWRLCREADERQARRPKPAKDLPDRHDEMTVGALWDRLNDPRRHGVASSTLAAADHLIRNGTAEELHRWLERHTAVERAGIRQHLEAKEARRCRSRKSK